MTNKQKNWLIYGGVALLFIILIVVMVIRERKSAPAKINPPSGPNPNTGTSPANYTDAIDRNKKLKKGDVGNNVRELQKKLNLYATNSLVPDGVFGEATRLEAKRQTTTPANVDNPGISWNYLNTEQSFLFS